MAGRPRYDFKLLVKNRGQNNVRVLQFINRNIKTINDIGVVLSIVKICEEDVDRNLYNKLHAQGITKLPALVTHQGKVYEGLIKIQNLLKNNITAFQEFKQDKEGAAPRSGADVPEATTDLEAYQRHIISSGDDKEFELETDKLDIDKRIRAYMVDPPKHRQQSRDSRTRGGNNRELEDNIQQPDTPRDDLSKYVGVGEREDYTPQDDIMERAYWGNAATPGTNYGGGME